MNFKNKIYDTFRRIENIKKYEGKIYLNCCVGVEYDLDLLEYFVDYYKELGVDEFFIILNTTVKNSSELEEAIKILDKYTNIHTSIWTGDFYSVWKRQKKINFIKKHVSDNDWVITVDVDEFYEFPMGLRELITTCEEKGHHCVAGKFVDRIARDGKLKKIDKTKSLWEQFPVNTELTKDCNLFDDKILLRKNYIPLTEGHHFTAIKLERHLVYPHALSVYHFHWIEGLIEKLEDRLRIWKRFSFKNRTRHQKFLDHYDEYGTLL